MVRNLSSILQQKRHILQEGRFKKPDEHLLKIEWKSIKSLEIGARWAARADWATFPLWSDWDSWWSLKTLNMLNTLYLKSNAAEPA